MGSLWEGPSGIHLVFSWVKTMFDVRFLPPKTHMGPIWGPYVSLVGSGWEGPSGIHLGFICFYLGPANASIMRFSPPYRYPHGADMGPIMRGFWVGRPIWAPYGFYMFLSGLSRSIIMPLRPYRYHMGPIWFYYVGSRWENPYGPHMGFICFYLGSVDP